MTRHLPFSKICSQYYLLFLENNSELNLISFIMHNSNLYYFFAPSLKWNLLGLAKFRVGSGYRNAWTRPGYNF